MELRILFYSIEYVGKNEIHFFQFILVQLYQLIFTYQYDIYFWCFIKRFTLKKIGSFTIINNRI